jgi:hypothetical protein
LVGLDQDWQQLSGASFVGSTFNAVEVDGAWVKLRLDSVSADTDPGNSDINLYGVSWMLNGSWAPLCGTDAGGAPILATAISGTWSYSVGVPFGMSRVNNPLVFTFACQGSGIYKCVDWGYKPWLSAKRCSSDGTCEDVSLNDYHQACVRMVRADYCGDGTPYTRDGTWIDFWDSIAIQTDTEPAWDFEAEWVPSGARCVSTGKMRVLSDEPSCAARVEASTCGDASHFDTGTLLMNRFAPR